jgi:hypothetical protein
MAGASCRVTSARSVLDVLLDQPINPEIILPDHEWDLLAEAIKRERADRAEAAAQRLLTGGT